LRQLAVAAAIALLLGCVQFRKLHPADRLGPDDRLDYLVLAALAPDDARQYLALAGPAERDDFLDWYWLNRGPAAGRDFYLARAGEARRFFGATDLFGDDRVPAYIRYGPPRRETFEPKVPRSDTVRIFVDPAEIWTYSDSGVQFDFVKTGVGFKLVGTSRFGPRVTLPVLEPLDMMQPAPGPLPSAATLNPALGLYRLGQAGDSVEVEVHYGIPLAEIARAYPAGGQRRFHVAIDFRGRDRANSQTIIRWDGIPAAADSGVALFAAALEPVTLKADVYSVRLTVTAGNGAAVGSRSAEVNLVDYVRRAQPASDFVTYALADSFSQGRQFERSGWPRLVPRLEGTLPSGSTCYLMYQLYNLGLDADGRHRVEADYDFIEEGTRRLAIPATPTRFVSGPGATATVVERVHTMNLHPGRYLVVARVRDLETDRTISLTEELTISPR
jgi:hypothetical protein